MIRGSRDKRNLVLGRKILAELRQELAGGLEVGPERTVEE
jgi:hypothetical protein